MSKAEFTIRQVAKPTEAEFEGMNKALAAAFADDKFTSIAIGHDPGLVKPFVNSVVVAGSIEGEIYVAENVEGVILGVAVWFGPGKEFCQSEEQRETAYIPLLKQFTPEVQRWWDDVFMPEYNEMIDAALGPGTLVNSWHLQLIGVAPEHQRLGIATEMIQRVREKARSEEFPLVLEPSNDVKRGIYERMGFVTKGYKLFTGPQGLDQYPMWSMIDETPSNT